MDRVELVEIGHAGPEPGLPAKIEPTGPDVDLTDWASANRDRIDALLDRDGGILFRGFNVGSVAEFERFCRAVCPNLYGDYGDLPTERHTEKIYGATPYPPDKVILFHNESSHTPSWPMRQFFHCVQIADKGGLTPLVDGRKVWQRLDPEVREKFRDLGLLYVRNFTEGFDVPWRDFFHTSDKAVVEEACRRGEMEFEWFGDDLRTKRRAPAVVTHPRTGETAFFNQIMLHHISCLDPGVRESVESLFEEGRWPRNVYYGDGTTIEDALVQEIQDLYWELAISQPWRAGDVVLVDNMLVSHARTTYEGARKVVVAMGEMVSAQSV
jgi:alpha-ketoglutarate-dependent taurine dioxygenase